MPASKHMVVVEKRRTLKHLELIAGRNRSPKIDARYRPAENSSRDGRPRGEKGAVSSDS